MMAHNDSEKGAVGTTFQETDVVTMANKEVPSSCGSHGSESPSGAAAQAVVLPGGDSASEPPSEARIEPTGVVSGDYSVFTVTQKKMIVLTASIASLFSPMASAIYCRLSPSLPWRSIFSHNQTHPSQPWPKTSTSQMPKSI